MGVEELLILLMMISLIMLITQQLRRQICQGHQLINSGRGDEGNLGESAWNEKSSCTCTFGTILSVYPGKKNLLFTWLDWLNHCAGLQTILRPWPRGWPILTWTATDGLNVHINLISPSLKLLLKLLVCTFVTFTLDFFSSHLPTFEINFSTSRTLPPTHSLTQLLAPAPTTTWPPSLQNLLWLPVRLAENFFFFFLQILKNCRLNGQVFCRFLMRSISLTDLLSHLSTSALRCSWPTFFFPLPPPPPPPSDPLTKNPPGRHRLAFFSSKHVFLELLERL